MKLYVLLLLLGFCYTSQLVAQNSGDNPIKPTGFITFDINVDSALLILNNQFEEIVWVSDGEKIEAPRGLTSVKLSVIHDVLFENQFVLEEDSTETISHNFEYQGLQKRILNGNYAAREFYGSNLLLITDESSQIILNENLISTEYAFIDGKIGSNDLVVRNQPNSFSYTKFERFKNSARTFLIVENYVKPSKKRAQQLAFLPGFSQAYKYESFKALVIQIGIGTALFSTATLELKYRISKREYDDLLEEYINTESFVTATSLGNKLADLDKTLEQDAKIRNISFLALCSFYIYNVFDGLIKEPKIGYRTQKPLEFFLQQNELNTMSGTLKINLNNK